MLTDTREVTASGFWEPATPDDWQTALERLQDYHGAAHCYVEITETELRGNARP